MKDLVKILVFGILIIITSNRTWASITLKGANIGDRNYTQLDGRLIPHSNRPFTSQFPELFAYIDPGTGSFIIQLFLGVLFGGLFAIKLFWSSIKSFIRKLFLIK